MKYEYKTVLVDTKGLFGGKLDTSEMDGTLNAMAAEGWELDQMAPTALESGKTRTLVCIFKRQK